MRRDHFTLTVDDAGAVAPPTLVLTYDGPAGNLTARLAEDGAIPDGDEIDASFRQQDDEDTDDETGVFSLTHRHTGEYILELDAAATDVWSLIEAARAEGGSYRIRIERPGHEDVTVTADTLLVYDTDGNLVRKDSLIPSGVEL